MSDAYGTIDFYVQGNGISDGFALRMESFTADAMPEPTGVLVLTGLVGAMGLRRRRR